MLFTTLQFAVFFVIVYLIYCRLGHQAQNRWLLAASYYFYAAWDWRFLGLILLTTMIDYFCALRMEVSSEKSKRKAYLILSIVSNLSILGFFKYFNFFTQSFASVMGQLGWNVDSVTLNIILPMGISFYTFQTMSYTIDVYRKEMKATRSFFDFALYVAFFPQLVAGPIERAKRLLPQILAPRVLSHDSFWQGFHLIAWGLFQKMFIADTLAFVMDPLYANGTSYHALTVLGMAYGFAFQIYFDFAGYSNVARGLGKCLGFDIMVNFNLPYFSATPSEFWKRWHISLSSWLRDYLYIPLGGNRLGSRRTYLNLMLVMLLGGLWHGAHERFLLWGVFHGFLLMGYRIWGNSRVTIFKNEEKKSWVQVVLFFHLVCVGWLIFRVESLDQLTLLCRSLLTQWGPLNGLILHQLFLMSACLVTPVLIGFYQNRVKNPVVFLEGPKWVCWVFYVLMFHLLVMYRAPQSPEYIYFQF